MGKGSGKLAAWFIELPAGVNIFEFKNLRYGRMLYFIVQIQNKLPTKTRLYQNPFLKKTGLPLKATKLLTINTFW